MTYAITRDWVTNDLYPELQNIERNPMTDNDACSCTQCEAKTDFTLIPADALEAVAKVFTQGAKKHGEYDWERYISTREHRAKLGLGFIQTIN